MLMHEIMVESKLKADRKQAELWRLRYLKSVERRFLEAGWKALVRFLRGAYRALQEGKGAQPAREQPVY